MEPTNQVQQTREDASIIHISREEYEQLMRIKLNEELRGDLTTWAKQKVWILVIIISILGIFGINFIIESIVRTAVEKEISEHKSRINEDLSYARDAATNARMEAENTRAALSALKDQRVKAEDALTSIEEKSRSLSDKLIVIEANIKI